MTYEDLPSPPRTDQGYKQWRTWGEQALKARSCPPLALPADEGLDRDDHRVELAWKALITAWSSQRQLCPETMPLVALELLKRAWEAPTPVVRAAEKVTRRYLQLGVTTPEVFYYCSAFAWPLREVSPRLSDDAWAYLVHAPWQTEPEVIQELLVVLSDSAELPEGRQLGDLVGCALDHGHDVTAREFLEAAIVWLSRFGKGGIHRLGEAADIRRLEEHPEGAGLLRQLARLYRRDGETQIHARAVLARARELASTEAASHAGAILGTGQEVATQGQEEFVALGIAIEATVWERPFQEAYTWVKEHADLAGFTREVRRVIEADQVGHATRLAESSLIKHFDDPWYGRAEDNLDRALLRFGDIKPTEVPKLPASVRSAAEHLAVLYSRGARDTGASFAFVNALIHLKGFVGKGSALEPISEELEVWVNRSDPYTALRGQAASLADSGDRLRDPERRLAEQVNDWFDRRMQRGEGLERQIRFVTAPLKDALAALSGGAAALLPGIEEACLGAFRLIRSPRGEWLLGDLDALLSEGRQLRAVEGVCPALQERARREARGSALTAGAVSAVTSLVPPVLAVAGGAADLGASLVLGFRAVSRAAALFGFDVRTDEGFARAADILTLGCGGCSSSSLAAYLSEDRAPGPLNALELHGVDYGSSRLVRHLWVRGQSSPAVNELLARNLARLCGMELSERGVVRLLPVAGAVFAGLSTVKFVNDLVDVGLHLLTREALLKRLQEA